MKSDLVSLTKNVESVLKLQEKDAQINKTATDVPIDLVGKEASSQSSSDGVLGRPPGVGYRNGQFHGNNLGKLPDLMVEQSNFNSFSRYGNFKVPKLDFPQFNGDDVRGWIRKANRYFLFNPIDSGQMVLFASLHLQGRADTWFHTYVESLEKLKWEEFTKVVRSRFSEEAYENVIGEFNKLLQTGSVLEYQEKFEELQALVLLKNKNLDEGYFVNSFISGHKAEIRSSVQMFG
ncbi:hypothetical protein FRX31_023020 [Thalictrum thalictroides]|uniref:Retrotransposon gag domain-containing protein n=1 Tax=Thalictrum thalictroides TaxID=46969 RepID=A0A7J6VS41_THATH|nr:hypothetical protein FRX31_023020 [Thalictrum thalictroides]